MKIAILHDELPPDARPDELDTLVQADSVTHALSELGHEPRPLGFGLNLKRMAEHLGELEPDCVFNLVESVAGQGRLIHLAPALLDSLGTPYTGARTEAMFLTSNKPLCKAILRANNVPTPRWFTTASLSRQAGPAGGRYIVKSVWEEASLGLQDDSVRDFHSPAELRRELLARSRELGGEAFAEDYIEGREFNLSLIAGRFGPSVLPPAEIQFINYPAGKPRIVGYSAKWLADSMEHRCTSRSFDVVEEDRRLQAELIRISERCWEVLGLTGYARVDFRVDRENRPWVLEVNANPCLSPDAGFVAAAGRAGLNLVMLVERLLADALGCPGSTESVEVGPPR